MIKTEVPDPAAARWRFLRQRTMYGGKRIAAGDVVFVIASENEGGVGLVARGVVTAARAVPRRPGVARQTPCVDVEVRRTAAATRRLGRRELKPWCAWDDGRPETELNFKRYRQATDKVVGVTAATAAFLDRHVARGRGARAPAPRAGAPGPAADGRGRPRGPGPA